MNLKDAALYSCIKSVENIYQNMSYMTEREILRLIFGFLALSFSFAVALSQSTNFPFLESWRLTVTGMLIPALAAIAISALNFSYWKPICLLGALLMWMIIGDFLKLSLDSTIPTDSANDWREAFIIKQSLINKWGFRWLVGCSILVWAVILIKNERDRL